MVNHWLSHGRNYSWRKRRWTRNHQEFLINHLCLLYASGLCSAHPGRGVDNRIGADAVAIIVPDASTSNPLTDAVPASIPMVHSLIYAIPSRSYPLHAPFTIRCRSDSAFQQRFQTSNQCNQSVHNVLLAILESFARKSTVYALTATHRPERAFQNHHGIAGNC